MGCGLKKFFRRDLTPASFLATLLAVAVLTWAGMAIEKWAAVRLRAAKVRGALRPMFKEAVEQRERLAAAIARYHEHFGFYPPDHLLRTNSPLMVDAVTNQLLYELGGCALDGRRKIYQPLGTSVFVSDSLMRKFFGQPIRNAAEMPGAASIFLPSANQESVIMIHDKPEFLALFTYWPNFEDFDMDLLREFQFGTWQYNSSAPRHNPGSYDLWIEIRTAETNMVVGNW